MRIDPLQNWVANLDRGIYGLLVGLLLGLLGGSLGLSLALLGPVITIIGIMGLIGGLIILTDIRLALAGTAVVVLLIPFGTLPVRIGLTPTFVDLTLGVTFFIYALQWMRRERMTIQLTSVHPLIGMYIMWLIFAFLLGMRYGMPTATILRQFAEMLLATSLAFVLVDIMRTQRLLRHATLLIIGLVAVQAIIAITLWAMNDVTAESLLVRLARFGYPDGGVIRYIESNPALGERAIGTWVDPNALGGILAIGASLMAPWILHRKATSQLDGLLVVAFVLTVIALVLSNSRASFLAFGAGITLIITLRYRRYLPVLVLAGCALLILPQTRGYIDRIFQAFQGADLATQMRIGEWTDALELIQEYPLTGIGFTGQPTADVYTDVANMYLIMANQIGLTGVVFFIIMVIGIFAYGWHSRGFIKHNSELDLLHLGFHAALFTALINATFDLYFFRIDFQASITWFWTIIALTLASSRIAVNNSAPARTTQPDNEEIPA